MENNENQLVLITKLLYQHSKISADYRKHVFLREGDEWSILRENKCLRFFQRQQIIDHDGSQMLQSLWF